MVKCACNLVCLSMDELQLHQLECPAIANGDADIVKQMCDVSFQWKNELSEPCDSSVVLIISDVDDQITLNMMEDGNHRSQCMRLSQGTYAGQLLIKNEKILPIDNVYIK